MLRRPDSSATLRAMAVGDTIPDRRSPGKSRPSICGVHGVVMLLGILAGGCDSKDEATLPKVEYEAFQKQAYPVLMRDCAFPACHGNSERLFQVYGPARARLPDPSSGKMPMISGAAQEHEIQVSFTKARSMLLHRGDISMAPLLRKPVQGGAHFGTDKWGRNVFASTKAAGYVKLKAWAEGVGEEKKGGSKE